MRKTFKYRLYAKQDVTAKAEQWLELCRNLYNCALAERIYAWRTQRVNLGGYKQEYELPELKKAFPEYQEINAQTLKNVIQRLDKAYRAFFARAKDGKKGFPRFKGRNRYDSFTLIVTNEPNGWKLEGNYLSITKVGRFKLRLSRPMLGIIKTITIRRTPTNKWYACFSCDGVLERKLEPNDKAIGLDMGIKSYLTDSEGNKVENPRYLKHSLKLLRIRQRKLARAKRGSNRRKKTKLILSGTYEKVANQRHDFLHKLSTKYVKDYGTIVVEDLAIKNMVKNRKLARDINDCSWGTFFNYLSYKAEEAGRKVVENYRFSPTSKACNVCGHLNQNLKLSDRTWVCLNCGAVHDRDLNAAKNIKEMGLGEALGRQRSEVSHA